jgi:hypothetical protein
MLVLVGLSRIPDISPEIELMEKKVGCLMGAFRSQGEENAKS